ncbi:MAG: uridine diphosphate-N-acetylglucosamine-binding protein YvcK [Candidatus Omnitrophica bacterium]|nr:uridine diphosphate-N-acetylglucosamine-binding protein YvcK [Candidatus Omnitrophota bacterium]
MRKILLVANKKQGAVLHGMLESMGIAIIRENAEQRIKRACKDAGIDVIVFDDDSYRGRDKSLRSKILGTLKRSKKPFIISSSTRSLSAVRNARDAGAADFIYKSYNHREFIARLNAVMQKKTRITCIGGGTGLLHILMGFKEIPQSLLTSVVSTSDDGGCSGKLKASFGILPPGDIRRSLVALSDAPEIMNQLMQFRFQRGDYFTGHNFGNLLLTALTEIKGSFSEAVRTISDILNLQGIVLPVTDEHTTLCARFEDGTVIKGESKIDESEGKNPDLRIIDIWHEPETGATIDAFSSILNSDIITIGPGDLFTSVITNLLVKNIREAISETKAKKVYLCNLMTEPGETANCTAFEHVNEIIKYLVGDYLDYVIISNTKLSRKSIREYARKRQSPVKIQDIGQIHDITRAKVIQADVGHATELVRHESDKVKKEICDILRFGRNGKKAKKSKG